MNTIHVINNYTDIYTMDSIKAFIDSRPEDYIDYGLRQIQMFGYDESYKDGSSHPDLSRIAPIEDLIRNKVFKPVRETIASIYGDGDYDISNLWISKQFPGSKLNLHIDSDHGNNPQFMYSAILYLNTIDSGVLEFPDLNFEYKPNAGDLVIFPSQDPLTGHKIDYIGDIRYSMPMWLSPSKYAL
mgnify:CR=1 FL=1